ncbi:DnaJ domain-containing protein / J24 / JDP24 [Leishmania donovani]|nr:DnaJ domain-containing protein / J24 / JDP24 [Leishmania donovani]
MSFSPNPMGAGAASVAPEPTGGPEASPRSVRSNTLYAVLNVSHTATLEEITAAYRKLALVYHPDRPNGLQWKFQEIQRAYEVLSQKDARAKYDILLRGKLAMQNFKRPPPLESVLQPVYALLADGAFYEFEAAPSKLKCSFHYGDGIQFNSDCGSFIGLAGDGFIYWTISGRGFASRLCKAGSTFALSSVRVMYRSNMGLLKMPLKRSSLRSSHTSRPAGSAGGKGAVRGSTGDAGPSERASSATCARAAKTSEADLIKKALLNKERSRNLKRRMEMLKEEETEERNYLQQDLWGQFSSLHTTAEAAFRCTLQGAAVPVEMALWMGYKSPEEVMLRSSDACSSPLLAEQVSLQASSLWVDPLQSDYYSDDEMLREACDGNKEDSRHCINNGGDVAARHKPDSADSSPCSSQPRPTSDAAPDGDAFRGRSATAPESHSPILHRFNNGAAAVSGTSDGAEVAEKQIVASPSTPPPCPISPIESSGEAAPLHPTSDSYVPPTSQPSCAANVPVAKLAAQEEAPLTGLQSNRQPHSSGLYTSAESGEPASSSLGVSSRAIGKTVKAVARAKRGVVMSDSAAALPSRNVGVKDERSLRAGSKAATVSSDASPQKVSVTGTPAGEFSKDRKACPPLPRRKNNGGGVGDAMLPVRLGPILQEKPERSAKGNNAVLSNKNPVPKGKEQTRPRWMMATEAYARRANLPLENSLNATTQSSSFCHEASRAYNSLTADQLFEEERAFMESFSKTKRII